MRWARPLDPPMKTKCSQKSNTGVSVAPEMVVRWFQHLRQNPKLAFLYNILWAVKVYLQWAIAIAKMGSA